MKQSCQNRVFYHITLRNNLENIFSKGLIPGIGIKCQKCYNDNPTEKLVYMTNLVSVRSWRAALYKGNDDCVILEVDCTNIKIIKRCKYRHGPEYASKEVIPPQNIKLIELLWNHTFISIEIIEYLDISFVENLRKRATLFIIVCLKNIYL